MICLYDRLCTDYTGNGLAVLTPTACTITEEAGGQWEASCTVPVTDDLKSRLLERGRVLKMQKEEANFQSQLEHTTNALEQADFFVILSTIILLSTLLEVRDVNQKINPSRV